MKIAGSAPLRLTLRPLGRALLCLGLLLYLCGCGEQESAGKSPVAEAASGSAVGTAVLTVGQELERIERHMLLVTPEENDRALQDLYQREPRISESDQIWVLALRGRVAIRMGKTERLADIQNTLERWPQGPQSRSATLALTVLKARKLMADGKLAAAHKQLAGLDAYRHMAVPAPLLIWAYGLMADISSELGELEAAIAASQEALALSEHTGQVWRRVMEQSTLAYILVRAQQVERARQMAQSSKRLAENAVDPMLMYTVYETEATVLSVAGDNEASNAARAMAMEYARKTGSDQLRATALANMSDNHLRRGQYAKALAAANEAMPLAMANPSPGLMAQIRHNRGIAKIALKQVAEGKADVLASLAEAEASGAKSAQAESWLELAEQLERVGDLGGAVDAFHKYRQIIDQVLREDTRKAMVEAQASFEDEQRDREALMLRHDNHLKAAQLQAQGLQLRLWLAMGGCVLLSCVLLVLVYRRIRKANQALADSNEKLRLQSERDPLTGLANRRYFQGAVQRLTGQGHLSGSAFLIDIDHFKRINDQHGHAAGDAVLIEVAKRLRGILREQDLVVRWGGEEFLIVVETRSPDDVHALAQRLVDQMASEPVVYGSNSITISASVGFASFPLAPHGLAVSWEQAIDLVDTLMYMAKAQGRNRAYGLDSIDAVDLTSLEAMATRLDAAFHEGRVRLCALHGPALPPVAMASGGST